VSGEAKKSTFGPWMMTCSGCWPGAALRGTWFDPFARTASARQSER